MALSLGSLFVKLSADTSGLAKGLNEGADKVAKFGNKMNEVAGKLGAVGVSMTALGAGALRLAGQFDAEVKKSTDALGNSFAHIAVEIGRALLPVVQALTNAFSQFAIFLKGISPETKEFAATIASVAAVSLTLVAGVAKVASAFTALAPAVTGALTPILPVLLPVIGVIAALIAIVPLLWSAWKDNFGNIQGFTGAVVDFVVESWKSFRNYFSGTTTFIGNAWNKVSSFLWNTWATVMKKIAGLASSVAKVFGVDWTNELAAFEETIDDMASRGFQGLVDDASESITKVKFMWVDGVKTMGQNIKDVLGGAFKDVQLDALKVLPKPGGAGGAGGTGGTGGKRIIKLPEMNVSPDMAKIAAERFGKALEQGGKIATDMLISSLGEAGQVINTFAQTMATVGDPMISLAVTLVQMLLKTESASKMIEKIAKLLGSVINLLDKAFGWLFDLVGYIAEGLSWVYDWVSSLLESPGTGNNLAATGGGEIDWLTGGLVAALNRGYGLSIRLAEFTEQMASDAAAYFVDLFRFNRAEFERVLAAFPEGTADEFRNAIEQLAARADSEAALNAVINKTADSFDRLVGSLTNVPAGFRVALARFNSQTDFLGNPIQNGGDLEVNVYIDGKKVHDQIMIRTARDWYVKTGGSMPPIPGWIAPR